MLHDETVYLGSDNIIALSLSLETIAVTHVTDTVDDTLTETHTHPVITRCQLIVDPIVGDSSDTLVTVDSQTNPTWFDFTEATLLKMKLGQSTLKRGRHVCIIKIFTATETAGVIWGTLMLVIK